MSVNWVLSTDRLRLREFIPSDAEKMFQLNSDPMVLQFTGDRPFQSVVEAENFLLHYDAYKRTGMGRWAVISKQTGVFIGWCGLKKGHNNLIDLGFRFFREVWNQGYATEAASACLDYGFGDLELDEIAGKAMPANIASIRVLEKVGMDYWKKDQTNAGEEWIYFRIQRFHPNLSR